MGLELIDDPTVALMASGTCTFLKGVEKVITRPISAQLTVQSASLHEFEIWRYKWIISYCGI